MLTRINGSYDIQSILKITPMPQLDALLVFWKLSGAGYIRLLPPKNPAGGAAANQGLDGAVALPSPTPGEARALISPQGDSVRKNRCVWIGTFCLLVALLGSAPAWSQGPSFNGLYTLVDAETGTESLIRLEHRPVPDPTYGSMIATLFESDGHFRVFAGPVLPSGGPFRIPILVLNEAKRPYRFLRNPKLLPGDRERHLPSRRGVPDPAPESAIPWITPASTRKDESYSSGKAREPRVACPIREPYLDLFPNFVPEHRPFILAQSAARASTHAGSPAPRSAAARPRPPRRSRRRSAGSARRSPPRPARPR